MTIYRFKAYALTPIFIGCGCEIDPTEFVLKGSQLCHFKPAQIISELAPEERTRLEQFLERADLKEIQNFLRHRIDEKRHGVSRIDVSNGFRREFEAKASNPTNQFRVEMMPRNPFSGHAYIPGSGIKGAIRTAVVNFFANRIKDTRDPVHDAVSTAEKHQKGQALEEAALKRKSWETHKDVFRLIHFEDCPLPDGATRIDRAANFNPGRPGAEKIQMWVERIKSQADMQNPPEFTVSMKINDTLMKHEGVRGVLGRTLSFDRIAKACNHFYWGRMVAEGNRFDDKKADGSNWQAIHDLFPKGQMEDGEIVSIDPSKPYWNNPDAQRKRILIRIGHFSHFESLSVDELRQGWNIKARMPIKEMGSTRTRCVMENGSPAMPFGWLLLTLDQSSAA